MWLSLIWAKLSSPAATADWPRSESLLRLYDLSTRRCITHSAPVPAHAMHFRNPRRSTPSWLLSCNISSLIFAAMLPPQNVDLLSTSVGIYRAARGAFYAWVPAPPWD